MSIQLRFVLLTASVTTALLLGLAVQDYADRREAALLHDSLQRERDTLVDHLLDTTGERLRVFAGDYSPWDEMLNFVSTADPDWALTNIDEPITTQKIDATWVLRPDLTLVHAAVRDGQEALRTLPVPADVLARIATGLNEAHFFVDTPAGLLEVRSAPIRPSDLNITPAAAGGWLIAGQLWNADYQRFLALLSSSVVEIAAPGAGPSPLTADGLVVVNSRPLPDWAGRPIREVRFRYTPVALERMRSGSRTGWLIFAGFGVVTLVCYYVAIRRWVVRPLGLLGTSLERRDPAPLDALRSRGREFDALAALVRTSFAHEQTLRQVVAAFNAIEEAVFIIDAVTGRIVEINTGAARLLGAKREELVGRPFDDLHGEPAPAAPADAASGSRPPFAGRTFRHRDGHRLEVETSEQPLTTAASSTLRVVVARDITARKRLEQQRLRAQRMESIGTLAGGVAHDLNNMLTPVSLLLDELQVTGRVPPPEMLTGVRTSVRRSAAMLRQLLAFGRGVSGERRALAVPRLFAEIGRIVDSTFPKSILFYAEAAPDAWSVTGDPTQLHQVLLNLCVNARDAMPLGGHLRLRAANVEADRVTAEEWPELKPGRYVQFEVIDSGAGISPEHLERIFEPFFTTKELDKGTGLGLSTTLAIVRGHGGAIRVASEPQRGTTFRFLIPAEEMHESAEVAAPIAGFKGAGRTVLIVEDEEPVRDFIAAALPRFGLKVLVAPNGREGLRLFEQHRGTIDLVVSDLQMPVMDGLTMIRQIRELSPGLPLIVMSGRMGDGTRSGLEQLGHAILLGKPFEVPDLALALRNALG